MRQRYSLSFITRLLRDRDHERSRPLLSILRH